MFFKNVNNVNTCSVTPVFMLGSVVNQDIGLVQINGGYNDDFTINLTMYIDTELTICINTLLAV